MVGSRTQCGIRFSEWNPLLRARALSCTPKKSFAILAEIPRGARSAPLNPSTFPILLGTLEKIRTHFQSTTDD
jgi:hypothetical protein